MKLSIIIVNYNTPELVYECLKTIIRYVDFSYEIILVENGSDKNKRLSKEKVSFIFSGKGKKRQSNEESLSIPNSRTQQLSRSASCQPTTDYQLLTTPRNLGFGGGNNFGAKQAKGEYLFLLNPDTLIIDHSISRLLEFFEKHHEIGAVTPLLYQKDRETLQEGSYGPFQSLSTLIFRRRNLNSWQLSDSDTFLVDRISAAALMIKRSLFEKLNGFDENIFMYMEDDDLCKRITNLGYKNAVLKTAKIIHLEGQASNTKTKKKFYYRSQSYFWRKHYGLLFTILMQIIRWPYKFFKTQS